MISYNLFVLPKSKHGDRTVQVYAALYDSEDVFLIVRKRELNTWWANKGGKGALSAPTLVNQAGQYAFPGGKKESGETDISAAKREFEEETGKPFPKYNTVQQYKWKYFTLVAFEVTDNHTSLMWEIDAGLKPAKANPNAPTNSEIADWEICDALLSPLDQLLTFLGNKVGTSQQVAGALSRAKKYSQDIDWYKSMAEALQKHHAAKHATVNF